MHTRLKGLSIIPVASLALAMMLPAGAVSAQTAASHGVAPSGSGDLTMASSEPSRDDLASKLARREVQRSPLSIPGREIVQVETLIPAGIESGWHAHPGEEVGYIIAGQVEIMQGRANAVLHAGGGFLIPPQTPHNARDLGPETGWMLSTYIVETGQSLATFVDPPVQR